MTQSVNEQIGALAAIETECHFVQVGWEMLGADLVPRSDDPPLQERKRGFNGVSRDARAILVSGIFLGAVVDRFVFVLTHSCFISAPLIGNDHFHILTDIFADVFSEGSRAGIGGVEESKVTAALSNADNDLFVRCCATSATSTAILPANIGFVHFDSTVKHGLIHLFHSRTNSMAEVPSCFVRASINPPEGPFELHRAHAFLGFAEQQYGNEPDWQRKMGIMEYRSTGSSELVFTTNTLVAGILFEARDAAIFAPGANYAFGPAQTLQQFPAAFVRWVEDINFRESHGSTS